MPQPDSSGYEGFDAGGGARDYLDARIGEKVVRIPATTILEIMGALPVTTIPGAPPVIMGLANYRGAPATVVDLGVALGPGPVLATTLRLVIVRWADRIVGLAVDDVIAFSEDGDDARRLRTLDLDGILRSIF